MGKNKTKIVLDADVIIHFAKGNLLLVLPQIFPDYDFVIIDKVKEEVLYKAKDILEKVQYLTNSIKEIKLGSAPELIMEYARLTTKYGKGESACMAYCRFNNDVIGSSNTKDITDYCKEHDIKFLTTNDFLYYAIQKEIISEKEAYDFVDNVNKLGSRIPKVIFSNYKCHTI